MGEVSCRALRGECVRETLPLVVLSDVVVCVIEDLAFWREANDLYLIEVEWENEVSKIRRVYRPSQNVRCLPKPRFDVLLSRL